MLAQQSGAVLFGINEINEVGSHVVKPSKCYAKKVEVASCTRTGSQIVAVAMITISSVN